MILGFIDDESFLLSMKHFVEHAPSVRPLILFADNHWSRFTVELIDFATQHHIIILLFPPNLTHILQILDTSVFGPFNRLLDKAIIHFTNNALNAIINYGAFSTLCKEPWFQATTPTNLINGFAGVGLWPLDPDRVINKISKFNPPQSSTHTSTSIFDLLFFNNFSLKFIFYKIGTSTNSSTLESIFTVPAAFEHDSCICNKSCSVHGSQALVSYGSRKRKATIPKQAELLTSADLRAKLAEHEQKKKDEAAAKEQRASLRQEKKIANIIKKQQQKQRGEIRKANAQLKKQEKERKQTEKNNKRQKLLPCNPPVLLLTL